MALEDYKVYFVRLLIFIVLNVFATGSSAEKQVPVLKDEYHEDLFIKPLLDGKLFAHFQFTTRYRKDIRNLRWENRIEIFPLSLTDLVASTDLNKLHFSLTKGNWNYREWGYSTRPSPPGAQIRVQFSPHNENTDKSWERLVNSLAGLFCASLVSADKKTLVLSKLTFNQNVETQNSTQNYLYSNLPEETLCTENFTPWKKLLPCYSNSGLASLLTAVNLLKSSYSSLAIDIEPRPCIFEGQPVANCEQTQLTQTVSVVFNPLSLFDGKQTWSALKIFGNTINKKCARASHSRVHVDITKLDDKSKLFPQSYTEHELNIKYSEELTEKRSYATFDVNSLLDANTNSSKSLQFNVGIKQNQLYKQPPVSQRPKIPIYFTTHLAGVGASDGTMIATIINNHLKPVWVTYMDVVPHFLRVYHHTLAIKTKTGQELKPEKINIVLSQNTRPALIEFSVIIPPTTEVEISYDFERAFLKWTDYKPDANKGVLIGSALIDISTCSGALNHLVFPVNSVSSHISEIECESVLERDVMRIYAKPLLIILPTPDFSMPYNVICLVCSVLAAGFGSIYSMTTKKPRVKVEKKPSDKDNDAEAKKD